MILFDSTRAGWSKICDVNISSFAAFDESSVKKVLRALFEYLFFS